MRHRKGNSKLGRRSDHRLAMFRNLLTSLFRHERVLTTEAKAKAIRATADEMVTLAKRESLHARRQVLTMVQDTGVVGRLFDTIAARFADRHGGYTRIIRVGPRPGDAAPMVYLELVDRAETPADGDKGKGKDKTKKEKPPKGEAAAPSRRKKKEKAAAASA
jgi:large subunit ribosomal protein L17